VNSGKVNDLDDQHMKRLTIQSYQKDIEDRKEAVRTVIHSYSGRESGLAEIAIELQLRKNLFDLTWQHIATIGNIWHFVSVLCPKDFD
jgi:hypothetical protein